MPTNRAELTRLLGKADGEFGLMVELEPFFQIAEAGKYPLASASEELRLEALTALRGIFGADAATKVDGKEKLKYAWTEKIEFFSCSNNPFPEPGLKTQEIYEGIYGLNYSHLCRTLSDSLMHSFYGRLLSDLRENLWASLRPNLGPTLGPICGSDLFGNFVDSLADNLLSCLSDSLQVRGRVSACGSIWGSLFYFLGFAMVGKAEKVEKLRPLVRLLPKAIPLGQKRDELGTWLVLVA